MMARVGDLLHQLVALLLGRYLAEDLLEPRGPRAERRVVGRVDPARFVTCHPRVRPVAVDVLGHAPPLHTAAELGVVVAVGIGARATGILAREVALRRLPRLP